MNNYGKNEDIYMNRKLMAAVLCCVMATLTACGGKGGKKEAENKAAEAASEEAAVVETYTPVLPEPALPTTETTFLSSQRMAAFCSD